MKVFVVISLWDRSYNKVVAVCENWDSVVKVANEMWSSRNSPSHLNPMSMIDTKHMLVE